MFAIAVSVAVAASPASPAAPLTAQHGKPPVHLVLVRNTHDSGPGSLRAAISAANAGRRTSVTVIGFAVRGTIRLSSTLPAIVRHVIIDGRSAPGFRRGRSPVVEINCNRHGGLQFARPADHSALLGLAVDNAAGNGVTLRASAVTLDLDYIGLNLSGRAFGNGGDGVYVAPGSDREIIGLNPSGVSGATANVISGNRGSGVVLSGSSRDTVAANRIGTNPAGTAAIGNGRDGLRITGRSRHNEIGGTVFTDSATGQVNNPTGDKGTQTPVFVVPPLGNQISGNRGSGVVIADGAAGNMLNGNFVGTAAKGDRRLGNHGAGVWIDHAPHNSLTGCKFVNNPFVYYNVLSGNGGNGLRITDSYDTVVQGNFFGVGANNATIVANGRNGILVDGTSSKTQVGGVIPLGNVSAGNHANGIAVTGLARGFTTFNTFGGLFAFKGAAPNGHNGLLITSVGGNNLVRTNVFSGNRGNGIELAGRARGVTIEPDIVGLSTKGNAALPNGRDGLLITGHAHGNIVGGNLRSVIPQNAFSGNRGYGIAITGWANGNLVFRSVVGTEVTGRSAVGNDRGGVLIGGKAWNNKIGRFGPHNLNIISGNHGIGVTLTAGTRDNEVVRNLIGLNRLRQPVPNSRRPVLNLGHRNRIFANRT
ncbi:MAG TPA: NosD domain-containing protein [Streptosporangiaceae bacterium]